MKDLQKFIKERFETDVLYAYWKAMVHRYSNLELSLEDIYFIICELYDDNYITKHTKKGIQKAMKRYFKNKKTNPDKYKFYNEKEEKER